MKSRWWLKLNPLNSLFGRIFLWFWLTALIMIIATGWTSRQLAEQSSYAPAEAAQVKKLHQMGAKLQELAEKRNIDEAGLARWLKGIGMRSRVGLLLLNQQNDTYIRGFPGDERFNIQPFLSLKEQTGMIQVESLFWQFTGPLPVTLGNQQYLLFSGRHRPPGMLGQIMEHPYLLASLVLGLSGSLCMLLAWSLIRPIGQLKQATQAMAAGNLHSRADQVAHRHDEVGQLGREFNHMADKLQALVDSQKRILADISHELRSPLARLQVAIGIAQQREQQVIPELARIEHEANRIDTMLEHVLTLAKLDAGQQKLVKRRISLDELLAPLCQDIQFEAKAKQRRFECNYPQQKILDIDARLVSSALENVLRNALRYCVSRVSLDCIQQGERLQIRIIDDGPGLPEDELQAVFKPFYRVSSARNRESGGTGLGLAIAAGAIASHGGRIWAENLPQGGLQVTMELDSLEP
ncbi:ATP-binding protein [Bowmanella yangjiangensis]|uniref:histidine kinase n=1 Tax=Bowmanella yangjiangensis TaxID=2811230 RepID=A0ABS3CRC7_9ALTE|nr:ATP-binding protein [Bowmanella yangjiangensis]MBN7819605.1 HAMP domain-containing protein [Bowmanella yangjiangensis]